MFQNDHPKLTLTKNLKRLQAAKTTSYKSTSRKPVPILIELSSEVSEGKGLYENLLFRQNQNADESK